MKQLTKTQIIEETVEYYSKDPVNRRSIIKTEDEQLCAYVSTNDKSAGCAVGRCMIKKARHHVIEEKLNIASVYELGNIESMLKPQYKGHSLKFWEELQRLHDLCDYWDGKGLTSNGKNYLKKLLDMYGDDA